MSDEDTQEPIDLEATAPAQEIETPDTDEAREPQRQPDEAEAVDGTPDDTEGEEAIDESQSDEDDGSVEEAEAQADGEDGLVEFEFEGKSYKLPPELKDGVMRERDYRHKTQALAEERKSVTEMLQAVEQVSQLTQAEMQAHANLTNINQQLEQFGRVDWNAWEEQDPVAAQRGFRDYQLLKDRQGQLGQMIEQAGQKKAEAAQQELAKRVQATQTYAAKSIPGWTPELDRQIGEFAKKEMGVDDAWMARNLNPQMYRMAHLAFVGAKSLERAKAKPKAAKSARPKPTSKVSGRGNQVSQPVEQIDDMDAYVKARRKQMGFD